MGTRAKKAIPGDAPQELRRRYRAFWVTLFLAACTLVSGLGLRSAALEQAWPDALHTAAQLAFGLGAAGWALVVVRYWQLARALPAPPPGRALLVFVALLATPLFPLVVWHLHRQYARGPGARN